MPIIINNKKMKKVTCNAVPNLGRVTYNGVTVWVNTIYGYRNATAYSSTITGSVPSSGKYRTTTQYGYRDATGYASGVNNNPGGYYKTGYETEEKKFTDSLSHGDKASGRDGARNWGVQGGNVEYNSGGYIFDFGGKISHGSISATINGCQCSQHHNKRNVGIWATNSSSVHGQRPQGGYTCLANKSGINDYTVSADPTGYRYLAVSYALGCWNNHSYNFTVYVPHEVFKYYSVTSWGSANYSSSRTSPYSSINGSTSTPREPLQRTGYNEVTAWSGVTITETPVSSTPTRLVVVSHDGGETWQNY